MDRMTLQDQGSIDDCQVYHNFYEELNTYLRPCEYNQINIFNELYAKCNNKNETQKRFSHRGLSKHQNAITAAGFSQYGQQAGVEGNSSNQVHKIDRGLEWNVVRSSVRPPMIATELKKPKVSKLVIEERKLMELIENEQIKETERINSYKETERMNKTTEDLRRYNSNRIRQNSKDEHKTRNIITNRISHISKSKSKSPEVNEKISEKSIFKNSSQQVKTQNLKNSRPLYLNDQNLENTPKLIKNQVNTQSKNPEKPFLMIAKEATYFKKQIQHKPNYANDFLAKGNYLYKSGYNSGQLKRMKSEEKNLTAEEIQKNYKNEIFKDAVKACKEIVKISNKKFNHIDNTQKLEKIEVPEKTLQNRFKISKSSTNIRFKPGQKSFEKPIIDIYQNIKRKRINVLSRKKVTSKYHSIKYEENNHIIVAKSMDNQEQQKNTFYDAMRYYSNYK